MIGRRIDGIEPQELEAGEYGRCFPDDHWYARSPDGQLCNLSAHDIQEHENGRITVTPSILVSDGNSSWHGFLVHGVWRKA